MRGEEKPECRKKRKIASPMKSALRVAKDTSIYRFERTMFKRNSICQMCVKVKRLCAVKESFFKFG